MAIAFSEEQGWFDEVVSSLNRAITTAAGNTLVAVVAANSYGASGENECQISSVIDDAHNVWVEAITEWGTSAGDILSATRISIWICAGARAVTNVTATATQICDGMSMDILEVSGITNASDVIDAVASGDYDGAGPVPGAITTTAAATFVVVACSLGSTEIVTSSPGGTAGFVELTPQNTSAVVAKDNCLLRLAYLIAASSGAKTRTWNLNQGAGVPWVAVALKGGTVVTTNANPNWPEIVHQVGFGVDPNDPADADSWTAITSRVTAFVSRRGRDYELARTEAGECEVHVNNWDSAFDPMNTASAYYPNIRVFTPYRVYVKWDGQLYRLFTGYVERWPQKWEDERGISRLQVVDGLATLAATQLEGALGSEILADLPWAYWPMDDGALSQLAKNKAVTTSASLAVQTSPNGGGYGFFGSDMQLQSEQSVCWRQTRSATSGTLDTFGACLGAPLTLPQLSDGILVELWAKFPALTGGYGYTLFALKGSSFSSNADHRIVLLQIDSTSGLPTVSISNSAGVLQNYTGSASGYNDGSWHHYVVHANATTVRLWVDGTLLATGSPATTTASTIDYFEIGGEVDAWITGLADGIMGGDGTGGTPGADFAHVAIFEIATVDDRRVSARANAGLTGFPEKSGLRMSRLLNYASWTAGRAIDAGLTFLGAAATIANQTLLAAVQDVANWENGLVFVDGSGNFRFVDRYVRFNQTLKYTFGEDEAGGEIPYETDVEIDYDPKYIYNDVTVTRAVLRLPLVTFGTSLALGNTPGAIITGSSSVHLKDEASIKTYFQRTLDKASGSNSISQCNAEATWILENYAQPRPRLAKITITPSTNPDLWPVALGVEIGDLVRVKRRPFGGGDVITLDCYVEQVSHKVQQNEWLVELSLSPVLLTTYAGQSSWLLGVSIIGIDTIVGAP